MIDIERTLRLLDVEAESHFVQAEAIDAINYLLRENARLQKATTPICVGRRIIGLLAGEGAWTSENGASVVAADELFRNDPYDEITRLREENARLREALEPFAYIAEHVGEEDARWAVPSAHLRAARAAIREGGEDRYARG